MLGSFLNSSPTLWKPKKDGAAVATRVFTSPNERPVMRLQSRRVKTTAGKTRRGKDGTRVEEEEEED